MSQPRQPVQLCLCPPVMLPNGAAQAPDLDLCHHFRGLRALDWKYVPHYEAQGGIMFDGVVVLVAFYVRGFGGFLLVRAS